MFYVRKTTIYSSNDPLFALSRWVAYHRRLYLILSMPLNQYDTFVRKMDPSSQECHILMSGVFERQTKSDHFDRVMKIMCTDSEAAMLLNAAIRIYPDIAPEIARYIALAIGP